MATLYIFSALTNSSVAAPKSSRATAVVEVASSVLTRLRAQQPVLVQRNVPGGSELRHANVEVANVGSVAATGVQVHLEHAGGVAYALRGPKKLLPRERGIYTLNARVAAGPGSWRVVARCSSCRR